MYQYYAPYYDLSGHAYFAVLMGQYLNEILEQHRVRGRRALDIACGTGTLAAILADKGWDVTGIDHSGEMLDIACSKVANLDSMGSAVFLQGDMRDLHPHRMRPYCGDVAPDVLLRPGAFDLITCTYDSLNYLLTEAELAACFAGVAHLLHDDGLFVADMNTRHFLEHDWDAHIVMECPGYVQVAQSYFDPQTECSTMVLSGFVGDDEQGFLRFDETHIERAYTLETVTSLLHGAGLHVEATYDCFTFQPLYPRSQRVAWIVRTNRTHAQS